MAHSEEVRNHALRLLERYNGDVVLVSEFLEIPRRTVYRWWNQSHPEFCPEPLEQSDTESFAEELSSIIKDMRRYLQRSVKSIAVEEAAETSQKLLAISRIIDRLPRLVELHL